MSKGKLFGIAPEAMIPGPRLVISVSQDGLTTATMDFYIRKEDVDSPSIQGKLAKGTPIVTLYPEVPAGFAYLTVDSWDSRGESGGYAIVEIKFKGVDLSGDEWTFEGSVVYTRNNSLVEASIFTNPRFLSEVTGPNSRAAIKAGLDGVYVKLPSSTETTYYIGTPGSTPATAAHTFTAPELQWWWDWIVEKDHPTYNKATSEWTKTATAKGTLRASDFLKFGQIDDPPGSPSAPPGDVWIYSGATESIAVVGDGANSYSKTWLSGSAEEYPERVYGPLPE